MSVFNDYTVTPRDLTQYNAFRGVTDFTQIGQFNQYESGYQALAVLGSPKFITESKDSRIQQMHKNFVHMLEYEFRGMDGLPDINTDTFEITDGINAQRMINRVTMETSITISMNYFEKTGSLIEKYSEYYVTGIKDPKTQAKTYHGLIADGTVAPGLENEIFTLMYYATDNTMLRLERAVLLCNCQLNKAELSMYNGNRENISNKEMTLEFNAFPVVGSMVDKAANYLLQRITGVDVSIRNNVVTYNGYKTSLASESQRAVLDSQDYTYGIMKSGQPEANKKLVDAIK